MSEDPQNHSARSATGAETKEAEYYSTEEPWSRTLSRDRSKSGTGPFDHRKANPHRINDASASPPAADLTDPHPTPSIRRHDQPVHRHLMDITALRQPVAEDVKAVDALILRRLRSDVVLINQIGSYIVNSGGKRLRPLSVLLASRACGYAGDRHIDLAAVVEFIHTATLLHDDVVDASELRRNRETANVVWGNDASVLVGDFLYSRAFEMMVDVGSMRVMDILSHATNRIAEGEVLQLLNTHDPDTDQTRYMEVITRKTATLFEAGVRLGAVLAESSPDVEEAAASYGLNLGIAFQLIDDALDYSPANAELGKNVGDDLDEGKPTLPVIRAMEVGTPEQKALLRKAIEEGGRKHMESVVEAIASTDAITYTTRLAEDYADRAKGALSALPSCPARDAMATLADFSVDRKH